MTHFTHSRVYSIRYTRYIINSNHEILGAINPIRSVPHPQVASAASVASIGGQIEPMMNMLLAVEDPNSTAGDGLQPGSSGG